MLFRLPSPQICSLLPQPPKPSTPQGHQIWPLKHLPPSMIPSHHTQYSEAHPKATDNPEVPPKQCCWPTSLCPSGGTLPQATASLPTLHASVQTGLFASAQCVCGSHISQPRGCPGQEMETVTVRRWPSALGLQLLLTAHPCLWHPPPSSVREHPAPAPQAHLIIRCLGKDLELALCGEQGAIIGASLEEWRAEGMSAHRPYGGLDLPAGSLSSGLPYPALSLFSLLLIPHHEVLYSVTFFF